MTPAKAVPMHKPAESGLGFYALLSLLAALMAVSAMGIDAMLPALSEMSRELGIAGANDRQWIVSVFVLGMGIAQLAYGPLADRFGRKPVLILSTLAMSASSIMAGMSSSFEVMIAARLLQGISAAGSRVLVVAIVRDCFVGPQMARAMSITLLIMLAVPVFAPALGQAVMAAAGWRWIFYAMACFSAACAAVTALLLHETLRPEDRRPIALASLLEAARTVCADVDSRTYTLAGTLAFGLLIGYITSVQQVFESFGAASMFPIAFAGVSLFLAAGTIANAQLVRKFGPRRISHAALLIFTAISCAHLVVAVSGLETLVSFIAIQALAMACFALIGPNFGALAMGRMGRMAGSAASIQGFATTAGGAIVGAMIGHAFNGTVVPLVGGFVLAGLSTIIVLVLGSPEGFWAPGDLEVGPPS